ncbi:MAG: hypothetical protein HQ567_14030 [Candidatus Nealsonbacteria bacterium]|nr:hypothetical protein [Candidatus Nealsonbacteria bacterium]
MRCLSQRGRGFLLIALVLFVSLHSPQQLSAASFPGDAYVQIDDPTGGLSLTNNMFTVSCWMRMVIPSDTSLSENMTLLVDRTTGGDSDNHAYQIRYNYQLGRMEFLSKGASGTLPVQTMMERPYLDRWYHVAVTRQNDEFWGYIDGHEVFNINYSIGDSSNEDGVSIGGWSTAKYFLGEIQELAIYQEYRSKTLIRTYMYSDQPSSDPDLRGYYKLGWSSDTNDYFKNFSAYAPTNTNPGVKSGSGDVTFDEVDEKGEQSIFDSRRNGGRDRIAPLSGAYTWRQSVMQRSTPGVDFDFRIAYSSANSFSGYKLGDDDPMTGSTLGNGWRHSFDARMIPMEEYLPFFGSDTIGLMTWDGGVEMWDDDEGKWQTRHKEYRGELKEHGDYYEWTTPGRLVYTFKDPYSGPVEEMPLRGRLVQIRDFYSNTVDVLWHADGYVTQVVDTVGDRYDFHYQGALLTNVTFGQWSVAFEHDESNQLIAKTWSGPTNEYDTANTRWQFSYNGEDLLYRVTDPRSNDNMTVYYDEYGRMTNQVDALSRERGIQYGVPDTRSKTLTDAEGHDWVDTFDRKGHLISTKTPLGYETTYEYDEFGNRVSTTEPLGWRTTYAFDERSNKTAQTNALGQVRAWTYHTLFNAPLTETDPADWTRHYTYDDGGGVLTQYDDMGTLVILTYTSNGLVEAATDANGNTSSFTYNQDGFLVSKTDPAANTWGYARNEWGWTLTATNPLNEVTHLSYDIRGNVTKSVDPLWREYVSTYDDRGNLTSQADAKGQYTYLHYDAMNQQTLRVDRAGAEWKTTYTDRGKLSTASDPYTNTLTYTYDEENRLVEIADPLSNVVQHEYDDNGNRVATVDKLGRRWTAEYDRLNRGVTKSDPLQNTVETSYDVVGRIDTVTSPKGCPSLHEYDDRGRLIKWIDAEGCEWLYDYDPVGSITNIMDPRRGDYVMTYGTRNERTMERNQDGFEWHYDYDELKRLRTQTDPNGTTRTVSYDAGGRPETVTFNTGRINSFVYDDNDNPIIGTRLGSGPTTTTRLEFDEMDRITECRDHFNKKLNFTYDLIGRRETLRYPDGKVIDYTYDALSRLTSQVDWDSRSMSFAYDKANRLVSKTYPNSLVQINAFDKTGRLTSLDLNAFSPVSFTAELEAHWPLDAAGEDVAGNGHTLSIVGTDHVSGKVGMARQFDGTVDDYLIANPFNGFPSNELSVACWIKTSDTVKEAIPLSYATTGGDNMFCLQDYRDLRVRINDAVTATSGVAFNDGLWHHLAVTWRSSDGLCQIYKDGVLAYSTTHAQGFLIPGNGSLVVGQDQDVMGGGFQSENAMEGIMDDLRLYRSALSSNQVYELFQAAATPFSANRTVLLALTYAYDRNGNKTDSTETGTMDWPLPARIDETAQYTAANRLIDRVDALNPSNIWTYVYDASGNMTNVMGGGQSHAFIYDEDNRVLVVDWDAGITSRTVENRLDAIGRRIAKTVDGVESRYVLDLSLGMEIILCDTDSGGAITAHYVHGPGGLAYKVDSTNGLLCYHADAQANIIATTDSSTNIVSQYAYTPYGRGLPDSSVDGNPYRFVGAFGVMEDLPDLYFMRARYYSAEAGVFLSTDPVKPIGPGWQPTAYSYANANPLSYGDPEGESFVLFAASVANFQAKILITFKC